MSFGLRISFSVSLTLSLADHTTSDRHLNANVKYRITPSAVSQRNLLPARLVEAPVAVSTPVRAILPRFARYLEEKVSPSKQVLETKETHITDTIRSQFLDRKSLKILLDASSQQQKPTGANISNNNSANDVPDTSLVQHSLFTPFSTLPEDPCVSGQSPTDEDDSGSDLVSSLLCLRVGGLSAYYQKLDKWTSMSLSSSSKAPSSVKHDTNSAAEEEAGRSPSTHDVSDEDWEDVDVGEIQGKKQCWKRHRCLDG